MTPTDWIPWMKTPNSKVTLSMCVKTLKWSAWVYKILPILNFLTSLPNVPFWYFGHKDFVILTSTYFTELCCFVFAERSVSAYCYIYRVNLYDSYSYIEIYQFVYTLFDIMDYVVCWPMSSRDCIYTVWTVLLNLAAFCVKQHLAGESSDGNA